MSQVVEPCSPRRYGATAEIWSEQREVWMYAAPLTRAAQPATPASQVATRRTTRMSVLGLRVAGLQPAAPAPLSEPETCTGAPAAQPGGPKEQGSGSTAAGPSDLTLSSP